MTKFIFQYPTILGSLGDDIIQILKRVHCERHLCFKYYALVIRERRKKWVFAELLPHIIYCEFMPHTSVRIQQQKIEMKHYHMIQHRKHEKL